jgi:transposase
MRKAGWTTHSGASTPPASVPVAPRREPRGGKNRAHAEPPDHALGRSRGGYGTKLHLVVDGGGVPLAAGITAGQAHESKHLAATLERVRLPNGRGRPRTRPQRLAGDKAYSYPAVRAYLRRRGIRAVIPTRQDQRANPRFDRNTYRRRNVIERCVGWLKENRRLATRYEKLAVNYLAVVKLAMIRQCLRLLDSSDTA